jgi:hypothetical protein
VIGKGFPVPLKRGMEERGRDYQGHQGIDSKRARPAVSSQEAKL